MQTGLGLIVNSALYIGQATLYDFSTRQHLFHQTRPVAIEQPRPHSGLLQDMGYHPSASLSFNINELKYSAPCMLNVALTIGLLTIQ